MEDKGRIRISEWHQAELSCVSPRPFRARGFLHLIGLLSSILIHAVAVELIVVSPPSTPVSEDASMGGHRGVAEVTLLPLDEKPKTIDSMLDGTSSTLRTAPTKSVFTINAALIKIERLALSNSAAGYSAAEDPSLIRADEIYHNQIMSRIERLWRQPKEASSFECQAQLEQDDSGMVLEILLPVCDDSPDLRESLLTAIRQASPLPAPPDPRVFSSSLVLHFVAYSEMELGSTDEGK